MPQQDRRTILGLLAGTIGGGAMGLGDFFRDKANRNPISSKKDAGAHYTARGAYIGFLAACFTTIIHGGGRGGINTDQSPPENDGMR